MKRRMIRVYEWEIVFSDTLRMTSRSSCPLAAQRALEQSITTEVRTLSVAHYGPMPLVRSDLCCDDHGPCDWMTGQYPWIPVLKDLVIHD